MEQQIMAHDMSAYISAGSGCFTVGLKSDGTALAEKVKLMSELDTLDKHGGLKKIFSKKKREEILAHIGSIDLDIGKYNVPINVDR